MENNSSNVSKENSILKGSDILWDKRENRPRKIRGEFVLPPGDSMKDSIQAFLQTNANELRDIPSAENLKPIQDVSSPTRRIVRFQQLHNGIPLLDTTMSVQLNKNNRIKQLDLGYVSKTNVVPPAADRKLTGTDAIKAASDSLGNFTLRQSPKDPEIVYYPTDAGLKLSYLVLIPTREPAHDWRIIVDAYTGEILDKKDLLFHINGQGLVFDPNPVVTANDNTLRDHDAVNPPCAFSGTDIITIDAQCVSRTLNDITFSGMVYKLEGPYVKLRNFGPPDIALPEEANPNDFNYSSADGRFEAVMVYYHVDTIQRYIQGLGITTAHNSQIEADAHDGSGGAWFSPVDGGIHFGNSGSCRADRGEEADAILHEYGHAIQNNQVPGWGVTSPTTGRRETRAMGEGFGDILACVFFAERGGGYQKEVFEDWVFADVAGLRRVDGTKVYPIDWNNQEHDDGEIWSAALWNIYRTIGGDSVNPTDRLAARDSLLKTLILSHHLVAADATMPDGAEAVMETNVELDEYRGKHLMQMLDSFHDRGLLVCSAQADLYIRDAPDDPGVDQYLGPTFWNSPDVWVRNTDDGGTVHQDPEFGQDNWFYARVSNRGTHIARAFVVTFNVKPWAGTEFVYPDDFVPYISATVGFNLSPGASTVVKAKWPAALVPSTGTHGCLLVSAYTPMDVSPTGRHVWEYNNLAQKNMTIVDLLPNDSVAVPFQLGSLHSTEPEVFRIELRRPQKWINLPVSIIHKDPAVIKNLFHSIEDTEVVKTSPTAPSIHPVVRFLEPTRVEIIHNGLNVQPVRLNLNKDSTLDIGLKTAEPQVAGTEFTEKGRTADLVSHKREATPMVFEPVETSIVFPPGVLTGFPIELKPRSQIGVSLKITAPPEAKAGDVIEIHLVQRNTKSAVVGGITVQMNIKEKK